MNEKTLPQKPGIDSQWQHLHWDATDFRRTMLLIAKDAKHRRTPAHKRPDTIELDTWSEFLSRLWEKTANTGREHGRFVLADLAKDTIVMGKELHGNEGSVMLKGYLQPGRESVQIPIGSIHTHPETSDDTGKVFSPQDYAGFLGLMDQQFMMVEYGQNQTLLLLRTSVTPDVTSAEVTQRVGEIYTEFIQKLGRNLNAIIEFNKMVCVEFGLTLYRRTPESGNTFRRIEVTH